MMKLFFFFFKLLRLRQRVTDNTERTNSTRELYHGMWLALRRKIPSPVKLRVKVLAFLSCLQYARPHAKQPESRLHWRQE